MSVSTSESVFELPSERPAVWRVCEAPERPLVWGAVFCDCSACATRLEALASEEPARLLGVKFGVARRLLVSAGVLGATGCDGPSIARRFGEGDDRVRELWVAEADAGHPEGMSPGEARILALMRDHGIPLPEWNVEVDATGECRPAGVRKVTG